MIEVSSDLGTNELIQTNEKEFVTKFILNWKSNGRKETNILESFTECKKSLRLTKIPSSTLHILDHYFSSGAFACLSTAERCGIMVMVKIFHKNPNENELLNECLPMALNHPFIRQIHGVTEIGHKTGIVMEFCDSVLEQEIANLTVIEKLTILMQVASVLDYCHECGIMHGDLKPNNVLLRKVNGKFIPALSDFGMVKDANSMSMVSTVGAICYVPPEILINDCTDDVNRKAVDVWGFAVMMIYVMTGVRPFDGVHNLKIYMDLLKGKLPYSDEIVDSIPGFGIVKLCLEKDPNQRPSFEMIVDYLRRIINVVAVETTDVLKPVTIDPNDPNIKHEMSDIDIPNEFSSCNIPLKMYNAAVKGNILVVKQCIKFGVDVNKQIKGKSSLLVAAAHGHVDVVELLLDFGADIDLCSDGCSPLFVSCQHGRFDVVTMLLEHDADIDLSNNNKTSPLFMSCQNCHRDIAETLLKSGADVNLCTYNGVSPLLISCQKGFFDIVKMLLSFGADVNVRSENESFPLLISCVNGDYNIVEILLKHGADVNLCGNKGVSSLCISCQQNHFDITKLLLEHEANVDLCMNDGSSPLFLSCLKGHHHIAEMLLDFGADINLCTNTGTSPLLISCNQGHVDSVKILLDHGVDVNLCNDFGCSPLLVSCLKGCSDIVEILVEHGAYVNLCDQSGGSPLFVSCQKNHLEIVKMLLDNGADVHLKFEDNYYPIDIAEAFGFLEIVELLRPHYR
eukprot:TRINITY_DN3147_c0_g1_i1.p1 TRINITY_DN3147_c0_g1~~TRINITY_DN3147_c0_g1_i1.p1  ORF type:complete len:737 (-),score=194.59 TRINITY_DN3147_c0_g1_i1:294-2504(-)